jgi:Rieske Fe-S protein
MVERAASRDATTLLRATMPDRPRTRPSRYGRSADAGAPDAGAPDAGAPVAGSPDDGPCGADGGRRAFLRDGLAAVAALMAVGGHAIPLEALTLTRARGRRIDEDLLQYPLPTTDGATIDARNKVILVRYRGAIHAFSLECPHRGTMVQWQPDRNRFYCPKHKSTFQPEGTLIQGKAERNLDRYTVRIEEGKVIVDRGTLIKSSADAAGWAAAAVRPS